LKLSRLVVPQHLIIALATMLVVGAGLFWLSAEVFERNVVRAVHIEEVREEPGVFVAVKDRRLDRLAVMGARDGRLYAIEDHFLYVSDDEGETFRKRGVLPKPDPSLSDRARNLVARHPLIRQLRVNRGPSNVVVLSTGTILVFYDDWIYRSGDGGYSFEVVGQDELLGVAGPFAHGIAIDNHDRVYFGEYRTGPRPQTIHVVIGENDGRDWMICHTFEQGQIFHVHSVSYDPYADRLLIATGDRDDEAGLFVLDSDCTGVEQIGGGDQRWRLIAPLFTPEKVVWGSDDDRAGAQIFAKARGTQTLEPLVFVGKPAYYGTRLSNGTLVQSTAFEPNSQFTRSASPEPTATLWISPDGRQWWTLDNFPWSEEELPQGRSRPQVAVTAGGGRDVFVVPLHTTHGFVTYRYRVEWNDGIVAP
jgi:hypothetical protein